MSVALRLTIAGNSMGRRMRDDLAPMRGRVLGRTRTLNIDISSAQEGRAKVMAAGMGIDKEVNMVFTVTTFNQTEKNILVRDFLQAEEMILDTRPHILSVSILSNSLTI